MQQQQPHRSHLRQLSVKGICERVTLTSSRVQLRVRQADHSHDHVALPPHTPIHAFVRECMGACAFSQNTLGLSDWGGLVFGGITFANCFARLHILQVAALPCLRRFFWEFVNSVCSRVFPHFRQPPAASAKDAPTCVPPVAAGRWDCINVNVIY